MLRPLFLTRATIGLAATAVEGVVALPGRASDAVSTLPGVPVKVAGSLVQSYLHAGQKLTDLAVKGDQVLAAVCPTRADQPEWATFDEDLVTDDSATGQSDAGDAEVPSGRVSPRHA